MAWSRWQQHGTFERNEWLREETTKCVIADTLLSPVAFFIMTHFSWLDYTIFGGYLAASVGVGLLSARGSKSLGDYFLAGRGMNSILVAMSILAALFSGISYLAGPADVYKNGFAFAYIVLAFFIATPITAKWMLPKFYQSRYFTAYQFLEERFSLPTRLLASGLFIFRVALWLAAATYAPALALEKVTGLPNAHHALHRARRHAGGDLDGCDAAHRAFWRPASHCHCGARQDPRRPRRHVGNRDGRWPHEPKPVLQSRRTRESRRGLDRRSFPAPRANGH
jgi:hypothetical protein